MSVPVYAESNPQMPWASSTLESSKFESSKFETSRLRQGSLSMEFVWETTDIGMWVPINDHEVVSFPFPLLRKKYPSYFLPLSSPRKNHAWWDTGTLLFDSRIGYRQVPKFLLAGSKWFWGVFGAYDFSDYYKQYQMYVGAEWCSSRLGACIINFHKHPWMDPAKVPFHDSKGYTLEGKEALMRTKPWIMDNWGVSFQYTYPLFNRLEGSLLLAYSTIWEPDAIGYGPQSVKQVAIAMKCALTDSMSVQFKYVLMDQFSDDSYNEVPPITLSVGVRYGSGDNNLKRDFCDRKLSGPPEIHAPRYMRLTTPAAAADPGAPPGKTETPEEKNKRLSKEYVELLHTAQSEFATEYPQLAAVNEKEIVDASPKVFKRLFAIKHAIGLHPDRYQNKTKHNDAVRDKANAAFGTAQNLYGALVQAKEEIEKKKK